MDVCTAIQKRFYRLIPLLGFVFMMGCAPVRVSTDGDGVRSVGPVFKKDGAEIRHGLWKAWYADGSPHHVVRYTRGVQTGLYRSWFPTGERHEEIIFDWDGSEKRRRVWDIEGKMVEDIKAEKSPSKPWWAFWRSSDVPAQATDAPAMIPPSEN